MLLVSNGERYIEDKIENINYVNDLVLKGETIDITGITISPIIAMILTQYEQERGPGKVIGSKSLDSFNKFKSEYNKEIRINKSLLANKSDNFGIMINNSDMYRLILDSKNRLANIKIACYIIMKNFNSHFCAENTILYDIYKYVFSLAHNLIASEPCEEYFKITHNSICRYTIDEIELENKTNLDTEDYIEANSFIPTWIFANNLDNHKKAYIELLNLVSSDITKMASNNDEISKKKSLKKLIEGESK